MATEKTKSVPAVDRAFGLLELLANSKKGLSLSELVEQSSMPKSSVHCLALTLERRGYLRRHAKSRRYMLGLKLFGLANHAIRGLELREQAAPFLAELMQQTGLTAHMAIQEQDEPVLVAKVDAPGLARLATWLGKRMEFHCTGVGKVLAAYQRDEIVNQMIATHGLPRHNENTIVQVRRLKQELAEVRQNGVALDDEEDEIGLRCIGAPVFDREGHVVAAVSVSGTTSQLHPQNMAAVAAKVRAAAARLSTALGHAPESLTLGRAVS